MPHLFCLRPIALMRAYPPQLEIEDFEQYLATDDLFVNYFNEFLELPTFPEPLKFNIETGGFEVLTPAKYELADKIKAYARSQTPMSSVYKNAIANPKIKLPHYEREMLDEQSKKPEEEIKTSISVKCLDKEQGIAWIKENRFPVFLQSELYMEYRLAKLLAQIETNKGGIKLTINRDFKPWHKAKKEIRPPTPVDQTEELIQRLSVTLGSSTTTQTRQWYSIAKQVEDSSKLDNLPTRVSAPVTLLRRRASSSRPISVESRRNDVADDADSYLGDVMDLSEGPPPVITALSGQATLMHTQTERSPSSVTFSPAQPSGYPIHDEEAAKIIPVQIHSTTHVSRVVTIAPEPSDDESDQGVGSESDESQGEIEKDEITPPKTYSFAITGLDSYAGVFVAMAIKDAYTTLVSNLDSTQINDVNLDPIIPQSPRGSTLSELDPAVFSEALLEHETKRLQNRETQTSDGAVEQPRRKSITFKSKIDDEVDSVFSDESNESELATSPRKLEPADSGNLKKFRSFLHGTVGEKLLDLWLDIDKSRFGMRNKKVQSYLQRMREVYVKVGSTKRLPNEVLSKYKLLHATQWTINHLQNVQRDIVEPLLLYWAPRFSVRYSSEWVAPKSNESDVTTIRSRAIRPMSSQSYPSPKTITIVPLRPRSCLPRIKHGLTDRGHVISDYHRYVNRDVFMTSLDPSPPLTTPSPIPSYLQPKVSAAVEQRNSGDRTPFKRPASAGPLTRRTLARLERLKSAATSRTRKSAPTVFRPRVKTSPASSVTSESTVKGSPAMESMLQALLHDTKAGWFFTRFCEQSNNKLWSNSIHFWFNLQDYRRSFYTEIYDHFIIRKKAQTIYSTYVVGGSPEDIEVVMETRRGIRIRLDPPFEDLFDEAEEYVLKLLIVPWNRMLGLDRDSYRKIELIDQERSLNVTSKYMAFINRKGILKEKKSSVPTEQQSIEKYEEDLWLKVSEEFRTFTFDELVRNRIELEHFRKFLDEHFVKTDLLCWLDIESFKRLPHQASEKRDEKAKEIKTKYLHKKYFFGPNSPATKDEQNQAVLAGGGWGRTLKERPTTELIIEVQKYVKKRIDNRWLPLFLATEEFMERQRPKSQMSEVAEDVVLQKKKKRGEPWRLLDNRWQSSSRDLMEFRRALTNHVTAGQFRRYVSLKGEFLENDVLFWLEVQKYKDFCHSHNEASAIESKVLSIMNCFVNSHIPPSLQIDISAEMAEKLIEKRRELGPYVFREAQLTVFRVLFPYWSQFCEFRKTLGEEKLSTTLERQRQKRKEKLRKQMREQEEETLREEARAAKEAAAATEEFPDLLSTRGSDVPESLDGRHGNQMSWSYGKYVESLEQQRLLLLMENEVKGRTPPEPLPDRDVDVSTVSSVMDSDDDERKSKDSDDISLTSEGVPKKKKKDKIIISSVKKHDPTADQSNAGNESRATDATNRRNGKANRNGASKKEGKAVKGPAVTVD
uniref:Regulator of G-protein signaling 22-like n=1 Tax=Phallusia mammillata TaxID=59560 RepID=A0A6F9DRD4_9ASCI|nr:regulator of G-protein signaling 22-like [Phallusia mammillata]